MNPYRSGLIELRQKWPWWVLNRKYRPEFMEALGDDPRPPKEWLKDAMTIQQLIENDVVDEDDLQS